MHTSPHPNQVRSACERCRRMKVRCLLQIPTDLSCTRCTRLSLHCQTGPQRKIGRPAKRELIINRQYEQPRTPDVDAEGEMCDTDFQFLDDLIKGTVDMNWPTPGISPFEFNNFNKMAQPSDCFPLTQELQSLHRDQCPIAASSKLQIGSSSDVHFETLSTINVELRGLCKSVFRHAVGLDFETFACLKVDDFEGMKAFKVIMQIAQNYLLAIKILHKTIGIKTNLAEALSATPSATSSATPLEKAYPTPSAISTTSINNMLPGLSEVPGTKPDLNQPPATTRTIDSPMAFLVISCFVQIIRLLEFFITILHAHIANSTIETHPPAENMSFADVAIVDFSTQALLAIELTQHTLGRIQLVLGLPSPWSPKSIWTGLLSDQKYREMLNEELSVVEGLWTTRPARLMEMLGATKDTLLEHSLAGDW